MNVIRKLIVCLCIAIIPLNPFAQIKVADYSAYLKDNSIDAIEFILSKLKSYRIVSIGEDHWIADHTSFFCEMLRVASQKDDTRPNIVALEFGNEIDQKTADEVAFSTTFMADSVIQILQHAPDTYGNPYKEYFDIFKCIWEINQSLSTEKKMKIRLLDPAGVQDYFNGVPSQRETDRDMSMFKKIRLDYCAGNKIIFYAGQAHTQCQIRGTRLNGKPYFYNFPSAGFLLKHAYPNDVYIIDLWSPLNMGTGYKINPSTGKWYERNYSLYDQAFEQNGNKRCGFDIKNSDWGNITMAEYYGIPGKEDSWVSQPIDANPYTTNILLSQLLDGIVFLKPSNEFSGATVFNIYTSEYMEVCRKRSKGELNTPNDIMNKLKEMHPILK